MRAAARRLSRLRLTSRSARPCHVVRYSQKPGTSANFLSYRECGSHPPLASAVAYAGGQPLKSIVTIVNSNADGSGDAGASYTAMNGDKTSKTLYFPLFKHNYNGRTTTFSIQNASDTQTTITAVFRLGSDKWEKAYTIPAFASVLVSPTDTMVPEERYGSLIVTGDQKLAGSSLEHEHNVNQAENLQGSTALVESDFDTTLFCPLFRNGHTSKAITSGAQVQNASTTTQTVTFTFSPVGGGADVVRTKSVVPGASINFYGPTSAGVPLGRYGSVTLESGGDIAAVVNERGELADRRVVLTSYTCFGKRNTTNKILIPLYKEFFKNNYTGINIQNVSGDGSSATVTLEYRITGSANIGSGATFTHKTPVPDGGGITFLGVSNLKPDSDIYAIAGNPSILKGTYGSVVITSNRPIVALVNEANGGTGIAKDSKNYEGFNVD